MHRRIRLPAGIAFISAVSLSGCGQPAPQANTPPSQSVPAPTAEAHGHKPGAHGGILVSLGQDSYHAEAVFEKGGGVRLYMLGKDEARIQEVAVQELTAYLTADGATEAEKTTFRAEPQPGDAAGKTSLFVGTLPANLVGKTVNVTINNLNVNGERFRIAFSNAAATGTEMPAKLGTDEERKVFLSPGGRYTAADIAANGTTIPAAKFKGVRAQHDDNPKPGEKICPISKTKANPQFTWTIGGKSYEFCCVPCIEEFVVTAKEKPDEIQDPNAYRK